MSYYTDAYVEKQLAAIARVRELHERVLVIDYHKDVVCKECSVMTLPLVTPYPCPTIQALDGEQLHKLTENEHGNTCRDVLCGGCVEFVDGEL